MIETKYLRNIFITDHLGNVRTIVDEDKRVLEKNNYYPYGLVITADNIQTGNRKKYNGKESITELDLDWYDYGARFYDATIGRFFTQDRFAEKYYNLSTYQYGANNPIKYIDVNGDSVVSIGRANNQILIENSPLNEGGSNFINTISFRTTSNIDDVSDKSASIVNDAMVEIRDKEIEVSSTARTPKKQAKIMYYNLESKGAESQKKLYSKYGDIVIDEFVNAKKNNKTKVQIISQMVNKINQLGPANVSKHIVGDPKVYNVFDIAPSSVLKQNLFHNILQKDKRIRKLLSPINYSGEDAFHLEIPQ